MVDSGSKGIMVMAPTFSAASLIAEAWNVSAAQAPAAGKEHLLSTSLGVVLGLVILSWVLRLSSRWHGPSKSGARLPKGSLGYPVMGETIEFALSPEKYADSHYKRYGSIFKSNLFLRNVILGTKPEFARFVTSNSHLFAIQTPANVGKLGHNAFVHKDGPPHLTIKKILQKAILPESLQTRINVIETMILQNFALWEKSGTVLGRDVGRKITLEVAAFVLFGVQNIGATPDAKIALECLETMGQALFAFPMSFPGSPLSKALKVKKAQVSKMALDWPLPIAGLTPLYSVNYFQEPAKAVLTSYVNRLAQERTAQMHSGIPGTDLGGTDMLGNMLAARADPDAREEVKELDNETMLDNLVGMWFGFYETTSVTLTWILKFLRDNPEVRRRVQAEHEEILKSKGGQRNDVPRLTWDDIKKMVYTQKFFKELQRMISLGAIICRQATQDIEYEGYLIPKGWSVFPMINIIHSDPDIYPEPARFNPDRFDDPPKPFTYLPFSSGNHKCPGSEVAKLVSYILIHHVTTTYTFDSAAPDRGTERTPFPTPVGGYPVHFRRQNEADLRQ